MKAKALVLVGLVFSGVIGYSMHTPPAEPHSATAFRTNYDPALERLCWHLDQAESTYAVIFKSRDPDGDRIDISFRRTLEEAQSCVRELLEDPRGKYSDIRIAFVTAKPERH
jgi:hypothetical protein